MTENTGPDAREAAHAELRRLSDAARPGPWRAYETLQADNFIVEESQGLLLGTGPVMGPSYDKSTVAYVVALVNAHRAGALMARESDTVHDAVAHVAGAAKRSEAWFTAAADAVLERLKVESTEDVMLYHDAVSVLVFARELVKLVAALPG